MSTEANKELVGRYLSAIGGKAKPPELVAEYVEDEGLQHHIAMFEEAFPGYELVADDMVAEGDKVAIRATFRGTHRAAFQGVPASNREVTISAMVIYRIANGRVVEHWLLADSLSLLQAIGGIPAPEAVAR